MPYIGRYIPLEGISVDPNSDYDDYEEEVMEEDDNYDEKEKDVDEEDNGGIYDAKDIEEGHDKNEVSGNSKHTLLLR